jgi:hypothetical protein
MEKAPALAGAFLFGVCIDYRGLERGNRHGVSCLFSYGWVGWGLDKGFMGFLGLGERTKAKQGQRQYLGRFALPGCTPAFGRAVTPSAWAFIRRAKALRYHKGKNNDNGKQQQQQRQGQATATARAGRGRGYIPTHRKCAMNGAPGRLG